MASPLGVLEREREEQPLTHGQRAGTIDSGTIDSGTIDSGKTDGAYEHARSKEAIEHRAAKAPSTDEGAQKPRAEAAVDAWPRRTGAELGDGASPGALARWRASVSQIEAAAAAREAANDDADTQCTAFIK